MHRALGLLLLATTSVFTVPVSAQELETTGITDGFYLFTEQEVGWFKGDAEAAVTSARFGYAVEGPQLTVGFELGPRYISTFDLQNRTDWSAKLEGAWVPENTSFEIYGEYEPALSTETDNSGFYQTAKWGLVIPLTSASQPQFDIGQGFADTSDFYIKLEQQGGWAVGGHQEFILTSPRLGYGLELDSVEIALEAGPSLRWSDRTSPHTDLATKFDLRFSPTERYEIFMEYEPTYIFQADQTGLIQILKAGLAFNF